MKDDELQFDHSCHVLYSKTCKKEIQSKIALHYPEAEREMIWEKVQRQYVDFLSDWRKDLGGKRNFHNGAGGTYDCIAIMNYYVVCKPVTSFREIEEIEENLITCRMYKAGSVKMAPATITPEQAPIDWMITCSPNAFLRFAAPETPTAMIAIGMAASNT